MEKILFINACVRPSSRTLELAKSLLNKLGGQVEEVNLYQTELKPLTLKELEKREKSAKNKDFSCDVFNLAKQFAKAENIVVAAPYWDLMFPAVLKCYFEQITVNGITFSYSEKGVPQGLCKGKKLIYVTTSGGHIVKDFGYEYVLSLAQGFYGIKDVQCIKAEGLDVFGANAKKILDEAKSKI